MYLQIKLAPYGYQLLTPDGLAPTLLVLIALRKYFVSHFSF